LRACGIRHAFTTRIGGYSRGPYASLNLGRSVEDDPRAVARNRALVLTTLGLEGAHEVEAAQVHGAVVAVVGRAEAGQLIEGADGLVTADPGTVLAMHAADCVPLLLADPKRRVVAAVHAGWRGTAAGVSLDAGVPMQQIETLDWCTFEHPELFYSFRRDGATGRNAAIVALESSAGGPPPSC